jgi:TolB-like protein/DNA-binding winged helix-turn-helix (wHTH) protein/Tfp pilus assembly protein PilF
MELLILLVERRGDLVSREEIAERLWGRGVFLDTDHSINVAIRKIRVLLHDGPEKPRFIETVVGKGYRFAASVTCSGSANVQSESAAQAGKTNSSAGEMRHSPRNSTSYFRRSALVAGAAVLTIFAVALVLSRAHNEGSKSHIRIKSLAVLPLKNLSGDPAQQYLADGMTEALIGRLARIRELRVISRTSVMQFKETKLSLPQIAQMLGADAIVEGSVQREGSQIRIHAQLIRASTDEHMWADEYQREYGSVLALEDDLARNIAQEIEINLTPQERLGLDTGRTIDSQTHEDYLKGRYYFNLRTEDAVNKSIGYFKQAIARDPDYALPYSGLADSYALLGFRGAYPSQDALSHAKEAALKASELDDTLAEPHVSLAFIAETHEWDWATAEREYKRALELNPGDARAHHWYAGYLMYVGRYQEGIAEARRARDLDPLSLPVNNALAGRLLVAGRNDEAFEQVKKTLELDANFAPAHQTVGWVYLNRGKRDDAIREFQKAVELSGTGDFDIVLDLGFAYAVTGDREQANKILSRLKALHAQGIAPSGAIGILYGALGEKDEAFSWLDKAYNERDPELTYIKVPNRRFEPLRHDPRFQALVHRIGLPE